MIDDWEYWDRLEIAGQIAEGWIERRLIQAVSQRATKSLPGG
jgi:hypothetical protein